MNKTFSYCHPLFDRFQLAHKKKMFSLELKTIEQWVTVTECLVHMSYEEYSSIINHLFQRVSTLLTLTQSAILSFWVYTTVQYSTLQYSTVHYSTVQYSTVQYSTVQYGTV